MVGPPGPKVDDAEDDKNANQEMEGRLCLTVSPNEEIEYAWRRRILGLARNICITSDVSGAHWIWHSHASLPLPAMSETDEIMHACIYTNRWQTCPAV
jgi:hypothetical protein